MSKNSALHAESRLQPREQFIFCVAAEQYPFRFKAVKERAKRAGGDVEEF